MEQETIIGVREKAKYGITKSIMGFTFAFILLVFFFIFTVIIFSASNGLIDLGLIIGIISFLSITLYIL